jgi:hypothetical protein
VIVDLLDMSVSDSWIDAFAGVSLAGTTLPTAEADTSPGITITSSVSGVSGEYEGGAKRAHLFHFKPPAVRLCYGVIGGGKRFCLKAVTAGTEPKDTCGVGRHARKFKPQLGHLYLRADIDTAFCQPCLPMALVPPEFVLGVLETKKTIQEWKEVWADWEQTAKDASANDAIQAEALTMEESRIQLKTPLRRGRDDSLDPTFIVPELPELRVILNQQFTVLEEQSWWSAEGKPEGLDTSLWAFLVALRSLFLRFDQWSTEPMENFANNLSSVEEDLLRLKSAGDLLFSQVGKPVPLLNVEFPDIWCALEYLSTVIQDKLEGTLGIESIREIQQELMRLQALIQPVGQAFTAIKKLEEDINKFDGRFNVIQPLLLRFANEIKALKDTHTTPVPVVVSPTGGSGNADAWCQNFAPIPGSDFPVRQTRPSIPVDSSDLVVRLNTIEQVIKDLESRLAGEG